MIINGYDKRNEANNFNDDNNDLSERSQETDHKNKLSSMKIEIENLEKETQKSRKVQFYLIV